MKKITIILTLSLLTISSGLFAQSLKSAGKAYDKANKLLIKGDTIKAIDSFQKCADISKELGELGESRKLKADSSIYNLYIIEGVQELNKTKFDKAIEAFNKARDYAEMINNPLMTSEVLNYTAAAYTGKADKLYKSTKYKKAKETYLKAVEVSPNYSNANYGLVLSYIKSDEGAKMEEAVKKVQQYSEDKELKNNAKIAAAGYYKKKCKKAFSDNKFNIVTMMAAKCLNYDKKDPEVYYYYAKASNIKHNWAIAEKNALSAIRLSDEEVPDYYFELGRAYEGTGKTEKACEAYSKVTSGPDQPKVAFRLSLLNCN